MLQSEVRLGRIEVGEIGGPMQGAMSLSTQPIEFPPAGAGSLPQVELLIQCQQPPMRIPPLPRPCSASRSRIRVPIVSLARFEVDSGYLCDRRRTRDCSLASSRTDQANRGAIRRKGGVRGSFGRGLDGSEAYHELARRKGLEG